MATKDRKCRSCPASVYRDSKTGLCADCLRKERKAAVPSEAVKADRVITDLRAQHTLLDRKYQASLAEIKRLESELSAVNEIGSGLETFTISITPQQRASRNEGTVIIPASDWHVEERVDQRMVSGLNEFTLDIAKARATKFFQKSLRLTQLLQKDLQIDTCVLPLLGDFITNDIHDEMPENNQLLPIHAISFAESLLVSGFQFLLNHSKLKFVIPCHSGNHARTTRTTRFGSENGHSLEYLMYLHLAAYFRNEPRMKFVIADGPHSYVNVYDKVFRFHHGHMIKYQGGIGGIFIPAFKAIAQWNKARRADYDVFGHFHQDKDGGNFMSNGSLIGYNPFALSIKADYEPPSQKLILVDKNHGRTCTWPIYLERAK